jgi:mono/diheme cytochrome c family protein
MRQDFSRRKWRWPDLTAQDLGDVMVYLRGLPAARNAPVRLEISAGSQGEALFQSKGCAACHTAKLALTARLKGKTLTDIGVAMWSHASKMAANSPRLEVDEMRDLLSYLWAEQFFQDSGDLSAGRRVFKEKSCVSCHNDPSTGAPQLPRAGQSFTSSQMVSALWHHGPQMHEQMKSKSIAWPRFSGKEMADLVGYLNSSVKGK